MDTKKKLTRRVYQWGPANKQCTKQLHHQLKGSGVKPTFCLHFLLKKIFLVFIASNIWLQNFMIHCLPLVHSSPVSFLYACTLVFPFGFLFYPEDGGSNFFQNVSTSLPGYTATHPRRRQSSYLQDLKPHTDINSLPQGFIPGKKNVHFYVLSTRSATLIHNGEAIPVHLSACLKLLDGF
jgi:hypothetical protein